MTDFLKALKTTDLPINSMKQVKLNSVVLALYNIGGKIFATSDICTHEKCHLSDGFLTGNIVECPCHGGRFDIETGEVKALPPTIPLPTYKTRVNGEYIEIAV
ncbi:non-heme iron oxygenase ferredoxin subunit [Candidatus Gottesmanbacteria bacterium]|nr:non-heme iron oxygenase ferredoxin subunit [Candidatus Gottesmanbacteria bacterium]